MNGIKNRHCAIQIVFWSCSFYIPMIAMDCGLRPIINVQMMATAIVCASDIQKHEDDGFAVYQENGWNITKDNPFLVEFEVTSLNAQGKGKAFLGENRLSLPRYIPHSVVYSADKCGDDMNAFEKLEFIAQGCTIKVDLNLDKLNVPKWDPGKNSYSLLFLIRNHGLSWKELCALCLSFPMICLMIASLYEAAAQTFMGVKR